jgi:hypothetical protein
VSMSFVLVLKQLCVTIKNTDVAYGIGCHIFVYWTRLNISYRDIYDVLFKVFFYTKMVEFHRKISYMQLICGFLTKCPNGYLA